MVPVSGSCCTLAAFLLLQGCYLTLSPHKNSKNYSICGIFLPTVTAGALIGVLMEESGFCGGTIETLRAHLALLQPSSSLESTA